MSNIFNPKSVFLSVRDPCFPQNENCKKMRTRNVRLGAPTEWKIAKFPLSINEELGCQNAHTSDRYIIQTVHCR
jgi:hypothetical protein